MKLFDLSWVYDLSAQAFESGKMLGSFLEGVTKIAQL